MRTASEGRNLRLTSTHPIANTHTQGEGKGGRGGKREREGERLGEGEKERWRNAHIQDIKYHKPVFLRGKMETSALWTYFMLQ